MILVDNSEPQDIINLLKQSAPVSVMPLNQSHRSDYYFGGEDGRTRQFSRKQAGELLGNIDEAEDQLRDYYNNADENYQIIEGLISPVPLRMPTGKQLAALQSGKLRVDQLHIPPKSVKVSGKAPHPSISVRKFPDYQQEGLYSYSVELVRSYEGVIGAIKNEQRHRVSSLMLDSWLFQLEQSGIFTWYTTNLLDTAKLLVAIYKNCQKPPEEHTTLQRYIKPRIYIKEHSPYVRTLMGLDGAGLGETKAKALIDYFGSPLSLFMATVDEIAEVEGFGRKTAENILKSIGRDI